MDPSVLFEYEVDSKGNCKTKSQRNLDLIRHGRAVDLTRFSVLHTGDPEKALVQHKLRHGFDSPQEERAVASMLGMVVGDAMGHPTEFEPVQYGVVTITNMGQGLQGAFRLRPGQWTDDASMGLCLADTLLVRGEMDPIDAMLRFEAWWNHGYNNAFGYDDRRSNKHSVGLGGNISQAMYRFLTEGEGATEAGDNKTSGNGSIMRLAPVPVFYHHDLAKALQMSRISSLTTHQGEEAAECCRLMAQCIVRGIYNAKTGDKGFLDELGTSFQSSEESVNHLARSQQEGKDPDRNWNWRDPEFRYSPARAKQQPGYIGSYAMDGLAMALHVVATTASFRDALIKIVNMRGDADSVGSVVGQIAGALYGIGGEKGIPLDWIETIQQWDNHGDVALKAHKLFHGRRNSPGPSLSSSTTSTTSTSSHAEVASTVTVSAPSSSTSPATDSSAAQCSAIDCWQCTPCPVHGSG